MSRVKWIKLWLCMCDDEKMKLIDGMKNRDLVFYVWIKLLIQAGKNNLKGFIFLNENVPYTMEMLAIIFNRQIEEIEEALKILSDLEMIEIDDNNFIKILNWEKHQNIEGLEKIREQTRKRVQKYREENKCNADVTEQNKNEIENKNKIEIETQNNSDIENENELDIEAESKSGMENKNEIDIDNESKRGRESKNEIAVEAESKIEYENKMEPKNMREIEAGMKDEVENREKLGGKIKLDDGQSTRENTVIQNNRIENQSRRDMESAAEIIAYTKTIKGKFIGVTLSAVKLAVSDHGARNVKLAIDKAVEVNKLRMNYIRGILENWSREGYPEGKSGSNNHFIGGVKSRKSLSFNNFEPRSYDYDELEKRLLGWKE